MKKRKMKPGMFSQTLADASHSSPNVSVSVIKTGDSVEEFGTGFIRRPSTAGQTRENIHYPTDAEIEEMDNRNAEVDEMTGEFLVKLIDSGDDLTPDDLCIDEGIICEVLDVIENVLSTYGVFINRPTLVEREDGEYIVRSTYDDDDGF